MKGLKGLDFDEIAKAAGSIQDLLDRVKALEDHAAKTDDRVKWCEDEIEALKAALGNLPSGDSGKIDTTQIMMKINMLDTEVKKRAEKHELDKLKLEISKYVDKEVDRLERVVQSSVDGVKIDLDNLRREFEAFKANDFKKLQDRVTALEK